MHKYFVLFLVILVILIIIFTVLVYNELVRYRNEIIKSWKNLTLLIDEFMESANEYCDKEKYKNMISIEDIINYYYEVSRLYHNEEIEEKIKLDKRIYNDYVLALNNKIMLFPFNLVASIFGFSKWPYFRD